MVEELLPDYIHVGRCYVFFRSVFRPPQGTLPSRGPLLSVRIDGFNNIMKEVRDSRENSTPPMAPSRQLHS